MDAFFFFQAEDGIRDLVRSRGLGDVYKRQVLGAVGLPHGPQASISVVEVAHAGRSARSTVPIAVSYTHLTLPTSDLV